MMNRTKSLSSAKVLAVILAAMLCIASIGMFTGCTTPDREVETPLPPLTPPESLPKVHSVVITYNDVAVEGLLQTDISQGTLKVGATVNKDDGASGSLGFTSSEKTVAEIDNDGNITLKAAGETVITASFGTETASIVLAVEGGVVGKYKITVNGGLSDVSTASVGDIVTLNAVTPEHKDFSQWIYTESETPITWISGNMFKMPDGDVTIRAEYIDKLYILRIIGGKVTNDGSATVQSGTVTGYDGGVATTEYAITEYKYAHDTQLSISAIDPPAGKMFVGWDKNTVNNRLEDEEQNITDFVMPSETTTLFANYSTYTTKNLITGTQFRNVWWKGTPTRINENNNNPGLEECSGYTFTIPATAKGTSNYTQHIQGSVLNTLNNPSQAVRVIFKNHGNRDVKVELYGEYNANIATSGAVTVPAGETAVKTFIALPGISNPWLGFSLRDDVGGASGDPDIVLDVVAASANAYPKGDKTLSTTSGTKLVQLDNYAAKSGKVDATVVNNTYGWTFLRSQEKGANTIMPYVLTAKIKPACLPEYNPDDPYITIYIRLLNQNFFGYSYKYRFTLSTTAVPATVDSNEFVMEAGVAYVDCTVSSHGQTELLALRIPRSEADDTFYFGILNDRYSTPDGSKPTAASDPSGFYSNNISVILTFNNGIGFDGDIIEPTTSGVNA